MKLIFFLPLAIFWINSVSQIRHDDIPDCEVITLNTVNQLAVKLQTNQLDSFDLIMNEWINNCSVSECTQRLIIIKNILDRKESINSIRTYFENDFQNVHHTRIKDSGLIDYAYVYTGHKVYFGYVPLNHPIDSIVKKIAANLLNTENLSPDEKLMCVMFSGDIEGFEKEIKQQEYNDSFVKQHLYKLHRDFHDSWLGFTIYSGVFMPLSSNSVFSQSPIIGFAISSPLRNKLIVELAIKLRVNINDDSFDYYALGETNQVNSDVSIFAGGLIGYKVFESEKLIVIPKVGIGLESVDTGISEKEDLSDDKTYHDIETVHLSFGLSAMRPVFQRSYIGIGINYHYCPYHLDTNLLTKFENNLLSAEVFWRF